MNPDPSDDGGVVVPQLPQERDVEWDSNSSTLNNDDDDTKERKQCWSGALENADSRKAAKAERKAAKNQVLFEVMTQEELAMVERALHPESEQAVSKGQGLGDNRTIEENVAFNANTFKWSKLRQGVHEKKLTKIYGAKQRLHASQQDNMILSPVFARLGISTVISKAGKKRRSLDIKLRAAILGDLVAFENEQVETMQRMAGYWRYANKRTYNEMVRNNELWDWATGEKLPEIKEEVELDTIDEEDDCADAGTMGRQTGYYVADNWDDPEIKVPAGPTALSLAPQIDRLNTNEMVETSYALTSQSHADRDINLKKDIESTKGRTKPRISKLFFSPGRLPTQTSSFRILSPATSDEDRERVRDESVNRAEEGSETLEGSPTSRNPLSPTSSTPKGFQGVKDTRVSGTAIRNASPPVKDPQSPPQKPIRHPSAPDAQPRDPRDPVNRFGALKRETPAPCEEEGEATTKKADPPPLVRMKIPAKPIVKTLTIHDEQDDWTTQRRPKGTKGAKVGVAALRPQAVVVVGGAHHAAKLAGAKCFAAVVKNGL